MITATPAYYAAGLPEDVLEEIEVEYDAAKQKHPAGYASPHEAASIIREEFEEFWDTVKADANYMAMEFELRQIAVTAIRALEMFRDRR